jgi:2-polyprenyl-3-methyl-5-hydroxy-6-metoxy-1,4-benzoquinol methylase
MLHVPDPPPPGCRGVSDLELLAKLPVSMIESRVAPWEDYDIVVLDRQEAAAAAVPEAVPSIGIDLGGAARLIADYVIDTLPTLDDFSPPNRVESGLRLRPRNRRSTPVQEIRSVLLTFGGEDPAGLTAKLARAVLRDRRFAEWRITLVRGPANIDPLPEELPIIDRPMELSEMLADYDLVITSFGLTAFEARAAGVPVITLNPSRYHQRLALRAGFPSIGVRRASLGKLYALSKNPNAAVQRAAELEANEETSLPAVIDSLDVSEVPCSPVTGERHNEAVARFVDRTYYRCRSTGLIFLKRFDSQVTEYGHDYFFADYRQQYGRTYLEDFEHIRSLAGPRLERIAALAGGGALLDVGCAFGPFLDAAREAGYDPHGVDVSAEAAEFVRTKLEIPCACSGFEELAANRWFGKASFDVLTMWFVIEHFPSLAPVLTRVNELLRVGGVFAFSTPNVRGISGRRSLRGFLERSPRDHFTVWSPRAAASVLRRYGFAVSSVRVTGHHPERFGGFFGRNRLLGRRAAWMASHGMGLGDTFEVFARKERDYE